VSDVASAVLEAKSGACRRVKWLVAGSSDLLSPSNRQPEICDRKCGAGKAARHASPQRRQANTVRDPYPPPTLSAGPSAPPLSCSPARR
jgi:hypothetical protein